MITAAVPTGGPPGAIALDVGTDPQVRLWLRRIPARSGAARAAILLVHGGNSSGDTFILPGGGFAGFLSGLDWDVWILEWRGSPYVMSQTLGLPAHNGSAYAECLSYNYDTVAAVDLPEAIRYIRSQTALPLVVLGHCVGSAVLTLSLARGHLAPYDIAGFVFCSIGLFVETTWNGWLKPEDFILERVLAQNPLCRSIDPKQFNRWPAAMAEGYDTWPKKWLPDAGTYTWQRLLHYFSFMVGHPYGIRRLHPTLRTGLVEPVFGPMHLGLYLHAAQSVRRGYLARFNAPDILDRGRLVTGSQREPKTPVDGDLDPTHFAGKKIILVAPGQSRIWHRDSIDLMYEWLRNTTPRSERFVSKLVFPELGLQELFWSEDCLETYAGIQAALAPIGARIAARRAPCR